MATRNEKRLLAHERQRRALELRKSGATYAQIADALEYKKPSGAKAAVDRAMKSVIQEQVIDLRTLQMTRLDHMLLVLWPAVQAGDPRSIETALKVMTRIDVLGDTEAAKKVDVSVTREDAVLVIEGNKEEFIEQMRRLTVQPHTAIASQIIEAEVVEEDDE